MWCIVIHPGDHLATHTIALSQATQLLQARKSEDDVIGICDMCDKLRVSQIIKILNLYTPAGWLNFYCYEVWQLFPQTSLRRGLVQPLSERSRVGFRCNSWPIIVQHRFILSYKIISPFLFSGESYGGGEEPGDAADGHQVLLRRPLPLQPLKHQLRRVGGEACLKLSSFPNLVLLSLICHRFLLNHVLQLIVSSCNFSSFLSPRCRSSITTCQP